MKTPIYDFVSSYVKRDAVRFHMPGHKGHNFLGFEAYDITEIEGADTLYSAEGIISESEDIASELFGTAHSFYSTEGSTHTIKAMLALVTSGKKRPKILASRAAHKSFINTAAILDADVEWIYSNCASHVCSACVQADEVDEALQRSPDAAAVYITSPDYLGGMCDVREISRVCHGYGVPLLVDNAHGAYLKFLSPSSHPILLGADMCCDSAHKTLPVLTGGAYLHISKSAPREYLVSARSTLSVFASTSPSYLILQSLDLCNKYLSCDYEKRLADTVKEIEAVKKKLTEAGIAVKESEPLKIVIDAKKIGYSGTELASYLSENNIEAEFSDDEYLVLMATPENDRADFVRLYDALVALEIRPSIKEEDKLFYESEKPKVAVSIREAVFSRRELIPVEDSVGRVCATPTVSCPPAVPIVVSGEVITKEAVTLLKKYRIDKIEVIIKE